MIYSTAGQAEKVLLRQLKQAKYFAVFLDCTPDVSHREQLTEVLRFVQYDDKKGTNVKEAFLDYLRVNDSPGKGLLNVFLKRSEELELSLSDCGDQCYHNGANMKRKAAGLQGRFLQIN